MRFKCFLLTILTLIQCVEVAPKISSIRGMNDHFWLDISKKSSTFLLLQILVVKWTWIALKWVNGSSPKLKSPPSWIFCRSTLFWNWQGVKIRQGTLWTKRSNHAQNTGFPAHIYRVWLIVSIITASRGVQIWCLSGIGAVLLVVLHGLWSGE